MLRPARDVVARLTALAAIVGLTAASATAALINLTPAPGSPNSVNAVSLSALIANGDGIVVGDKVFTGFAYSRTGDMPQSSSINVLGFRDPNNNWGITFHGSFVDLPGNGGSDAFIRYMVAVDPASQERGLRISDAHLFIHGAGLGPNSFFSVDETFFEKPTETLNAFITTLGGPQQAQLSDQVVFATPTPKLNVTKDIFALAADNGFVPARATVIDQSFSQIPEPTALLMMGASLAGVAAVVRRRGK